MGVNLLQIKRDYDELKKHCDYLADMIVTIYEINEPSIEGYEPLRELYVYVLENKLGSKND